MSRPSAPRIVVTAADPARQADPELARRKIERYASAVARHGAEPIVVHAGLGGDEWADALRRMDGLLLSGGTDLDPARYGRPNLGSRGIDAARDRLEETAWDVAAERALPVLGVCRGFQAINVFSGGTLLQDVDGHDGSSSGPGRVKAHPLRVEPGTRLARILFPTNVRGGVVEVNSSHHQGITPADLAPGLVPNAQATSPVGDLVEGLETREGRFVLGIQSHPERTESTPAAFDRLFAFFVDAARGPATRR